jgi:hypothetical protein
MSSTTKIIAAVFAVLVVVAVAIAVWLRSATEGPDADRSAAVATPLPPPSPTPTLAERLSVRLAGTTLATSDAVVRELVGQLSSRPVLAKWLANEDLVRRFVAAVDNVANGISPTTQLAFMRPEERFKVVERGDRSFIDTVSYDRYDQATQVFLSLDTAGTAALFHELEPLIDEAYKEISPPGSRFTDRLSAAIDHLLEVVPPTEAPEVRRKVVTWVYVDPSLEGLSGAQRQLLRMGPDNVLLIKAKLRELKAALTNEQSGGMRGDEVRR